MTLKEITLVPVVRLLDKNKQIGGYGGELQIYICFGIQFISVFYFSCLDLEVAINDNSLFLFILIAEYSLVRSVLLFLKRE